MVKEIAIFAALILSGLIIFQMLLILGLPLGNYAWGGSHKVLPANLRMGSFIVILLYLLFAFIILEKADVISILSSKALSDIGIWVITIILIISTIMQAISQSNYEKITMTPISFILSCLYLLVALHEAPG